jgi:hypothetical protein
MAATFCCFSIAEQPSRALPGLPPQPRRLVSRFAEPHLAGRNTPYGFIGSAGHTRAREFARNDCPDYLKNKIERKRGKDIGLDQRFTFFRYISQQKREPTRAELLQESHERVAAFDAA